MIEENGRNMENCAEKTVFLCEHILKKVVFCSNIITIFIQCSKIKTFLDRPNKY